MYSGSMERRSDYVRVCVCVCVSIFGIDLPISRIYCTGKNVGGSGKKLSTQQQHFCCVRCMVYKLYIVGLNLNDIGCIRWPGWQ